MKPFLKWAGNKFKIFKRIQAVLPQGRRLVEPFCGSGAVFLNTNYSSYLLADVNQDLVHLYTILQTDGQSFIHFAKSFFIPENNTSEAYYTLRNQFNTTEDVHLKSALFLYLNRHGYNGLCRYNASGGFNVPFGRYVKPYFPEVEMQFFHAKSKQAEIVCCDFIQAMDLASGGDVVYCDPPYVPLSDTANFTSYSSGGFGREKQLTLAAKAAELADKGIPVLISNHYNEFTAAAYSAASITTFDVQRFISCDGASRGKATEVLALYETRHRQFT